MILRILVDLLILLLAVLLCYGALVLLIVLPLAAIDYWDKRLGDLRTLWRRQKTGKLP